MNLHNKILSATDPTKTCHDLPDRRRPQDTRLVKNLVIVNSLVFYLVGETCCPGAKCWCDYVEEGGGVTNTKAPPATSAPSAPTALPTSTGRSSSSRAGQVVVGAFSVIVQLHRLIDLRH